MNTVRNFGVAVAAVAAMVVAAGTARQRSDTGTRAGIPDTRAVRAGTAGGQTYPMTVNEGAR